MTLLDPAALTRSIDEAVALHAPQAKAEPSFWSRVGGALAGAPAGGKEAGAMMADTLKAFGESAATVVEADPFATAIVGRDKVRADADTSRATIARGEAFTSEAGTTWRADARAMRPDPATATIAESIVFDAARVLTKAIGYSVAGGPLLGAAATGVDEGMTEVDRLIAQGVDPETARNAGVVTAVATGASVALPVAGSTLPRTLGLAALGGPATFVAQQATTRAILEDAGYTRQAQAYDPTDPLGLGLSFAIPAVFGAGVHAARAVRRPAAAQPAGAPSLSPVTQAAREAMATPAAPVEARTFGTVADPEHVDAAMAHNLTLLREKQAAVPRSAVPLSPEGQLVEEAARQRVLSDPAGTLRAYRELPGTHGGRVVNTDEARNLFPEYAATADTRALYAAAVHGPASWVANAQWSHLLAQPPETGRVLILGGGGGSGKTSSLEAIRPGFVDEFDGIFDMTMASESKALRVIGDALATGRRVEVAFTFRDPFESLQGVVQRAQRTGRTVPLAIAAKAHADAATTLRRVVAQFERDDRVAFTFVDNTRGPGQQRIVGEIPGFDYNGTAERATAFARAELEKGSLRETVFRGLVGASESEAATRLREGEGRPADARAGREPAPQHAGVSGTGAARSRADEARAAVDTARSTAREFAASGQSLDEFIGTRDAAGGADTAPRNLAVGLAEAGGDTIRAKRMLDDFARTAEAHPDVPLANVAADVVEASRAGREVTPKQPAEALKADPARDLVAQRVSRVEADAPDLPVARSEDGATQTAREVMDTARREAAEGTDDALGALDAPLLEVAARCFLTNGA